MFGALGNTWRYNFYMGTQNGYKFRFLIHVLYAQESVFLMFVQRSHTCIFAMIYTSIETSPNVCTGKPCICREPACIVELHLAMLQFYIQ